MPDDVQRYSSSRFPVLQTGPQTLTPLPQSPSNPRKRKDCPDDTGQTDKTPSTAPHAHEYGAGFITCQTCGTEVSFRDETNAFTTKLWNAHRLTCSSSSSSTNVPVVFTPKIAADALAHPPAKRRRAKRTEKERIEYLRSDPYVGQFEAYRVLCASCDKWIRLRPNSTYCSIPWDTHRKSCLAKKIDNKNVYALEERSTLFSKDPDVRKFDPERLLCNICDKWLSLPPDDHLQAVQKWLQHRATCQKSAAASCSFVARGTHNGAPRAPMNQDPETRKLVATSASQSSSFPQHHFPPYSASPPFQALTPLNNDPAHESRRRDAEQRAVNLREDPYTLVVEPNRVFCKLCSKWVQLHQDISYCAYHWVQHRQKCEARHFRRNQKAVEMTEMRGRKQTFPPPVDHEQDELTSDSDLAPASSQSVAIGGSEDVESESSGHCHGREVKSGANQGQILPPQSSSRHFDGLSPFSGHGHHPVFYAQQAQPYRHHKSRREPTLYDLPQTPRKYPGRSMSQAASTPAVVIRAMGDHEASTAPKTSDPSTDHEAAAEDPTAVRASELATRRVRRSGNRGSSSSFFKDMESIDIPGGNFNQTSSHEQHIYNIHVYPHTNKHDDSPSPSRRRGSEPIPTRQTQRRVAQGHTVSRNPSQATGEAAGAVIDTSLTPPSNDRHTQSIRPMFISQLSTLGLYYPFPDPFPPVTYAINPIYLTWPPVSNPHSYGMPDSDIGLQGGRPGED